VRTANTVVVHSKPKLKDPILLEGLPGIGNVGKTVADHLAEVFGAKLFVTVYSKHFPPQATLDGECVASLASNELWYAKDVGGHDLVFLLGDCQGLTPDGQYEVCKEMMEDVFLKIGVSRIYTLGGYGTGLISECPRVLGAVSDAGMKPELEEAGVVFSMGEPGAGIVGASGLFLGFGKIAGIPSACLMGETSGHFVDHKSALAVVEVLEKLIGFEIDKTMFEEMARHIDELAAHIAENEKTDSGDLGYIG